MKKFMKWLPFLCIFVAISPLVAETMKPDIVDIQSAIKYQGTDKTNILVTKVQDVTLTSGSSTVNTGLGTCTSVLFLPKTSSTGTTTTGFRYTTNGNTATIYAYSSNTGGTSTESFEGTGLFYGTP